MAKTETHTNSVKSDETAQIKPSHKDLYCLLFYFNFLLDAPICNIGHIQIQKCKSPPQKFMVCVSHAQSTNLCNL